VQAITNVSAARIFTTVEEETLSIEAVISGMGADVEMTTDLDALLRHEAMVAATTIVLAEEAQIDIQTIDETGRGHQWVEVVGEDSAHVVEVLMTKLLCLFQDVTREMYPTFS
jgi:hypothetical protein